MHHLQYCVATSNIAPQQNHANLSLEGGSPQPSIDGVERKNAMIAALLNRARSRLAKRLEYNRVIDEIQALTHRDLADMGADRSDMLRRAHQDFYGR
jgi:uncharacterized protein YjiS (DUF1127 family)